MIHQLQLDYLRWCWTEFMCGSDEHLGLIFDYCYPQITVALQNLDKKRGDHPGTRMTLEVTTTAIAEAYLKLLRKGRVEEYAKPGDPFAIVLRYCATEVSNELRRQDRNSDRFVEMEEDFPSNLQWDVLLDSAPSRFRIFLRIRRILTSDLQWELMKLWLRHAGELPPHALLHGDPREEMTQERMAAILERKPSAVSRSKKTAVQLLRRHYPELEEILETT
jgi:hypothetical protein